MALYVEDKLNGEGLVWGSEVRIEIDPPPNTTYRPKLSIPEHRRPSPATTSTDVDTDADADDEGSLRIPSPAQSSPSPCPFLSTQLQSQTTTATDIRGRPRSRTKQLRRRAIDLSRDELRISSRWSDGEKRSMEDFRDALRQKNYGSGATQTAREVCDRDGEQRLSGVSTSAAGSCNSSCVSPSKRRGRSLIVEIGYIKDRVAKGLRDSVSRGRRGCQNVVNSATATAVTNFSRPTRVRQRDEVKSFGEDTYSQSTRCMIPHSQARNTYTEAANPKSPNICDNTQPPSYPSITTQHREHYDQASSHSATSSWQEHLEQDLRLRPSHRTLTNTTNPQQQQQRQQRQPVRGKKRTYLLRNEPTATSTSKCISISAETKTQPTNPHEHDDSNTHGKTTFSFPVVGLQRPILPSASSSCYYPYYNSLDSYNPTSLKTWISNMARHGSEAVPLLQSSSSTTTTSASTTATSDLSLRRDGDMHLDVDVDVDVDVDMNRYWRLPSLPDGGGSSGGL